MKNNILMKAKQCLLCVTRKDNLPSILVGTICLIIAAAILIVPNNKRDSNPLDISEYSSVSTICELATLRNYYHNVIVYEKKPDSTEKTISDILFWPFNELLKTGYKQFWMEYSGIVEVGIDAKADHIQINKPNIDGVVDVYIPDAKVLNVDADEDSFSQPLSETGFLATITSEERREAYAEAQSAMRREAENDQALLFRAKNNAKIILEQYIKNVGKEMGVEYTVNWINSPRE